MRRIVPLLAAALFGVLTVAHAQVPEITAPGVFVPPDLSKSYEPGGYQLGGDLVKHYQQRGATRIVFQDYAGMNDSLPLYDYERDLPVEGISIPTDKTGADLFQSSHRDGPFTVFTAEVRSEDAVSTRLCLDLGHLQNSEEVWIASPLTGETFGPYYSHDNQPDGLWLPRVEGDTSLIIVRSLVDETPEMALKHVAHMYVDLQTTLPEQFACLTNIACETDTGIQELRTGVGLLSFGIPTNFVNGRFIFQFSLCSGTLLNNPVNAQPEPLFLTANHCIDTQLSARTAEVIWDWESNQCFTLDIPQDSTTVRVPIYFERGSQYNNRLPNGDLILPSIFQFDVDFNRNVLALPNNNVDFQPNPRLAAWYGKDFEVEELDNGALRFRMDRGGHIGPVLAVDMTPDAAFIVTGGADTTARLWSVLQQVQPVVYNGHTGPVNSVAISPDRSLVVTGSDDGTARLWERETGAQVRILQGHTDAVNSVAFSPNGNFVVTGSSDETAKLWRVSDGLEIRAFGVEDEDDEDAVTHDGAVNGVAYSPNGDRIVTGSEDGTAIVWNVNTGDAILVLGGPDVTAAHSDAITSVAYSANGQRIATGSVDETAKAWDANSGQVVLTFAGHEGPVNAVRFSASGDSLITASADETGRVWSTADATETFVYEDHTAALNDVAISSNGELIVSASDDGTARVWERFTGGLFRRLQGTRLTTFNNQLPVPIPEFGTDQENPFLLGELVLVDVGGTGTSTQIALFNAFGDAPLSACSGGYSDSGALGACFRYPEDLTLFIPPLSRFSLPRSRVDCILATNPFVDATLLRLGASRGLYADQPVEPAYSGRFYSGWTTRAPQIGDQVFNISHPAGLDKKFASGAITDTAATRRVSGRPYRDQIGVLMDRGLILGGSSGSGLFLNDGSNALIGITSNGRVDVTCINRFPDYYGAFAAFFPDIEPFIYRPFSAPCFVPGFDTDALDNLRAMPIRDTGRVVLTWQRPTIEPQQLVLVRRTDRFPRSHTDGTQIQLDTIDRSYIDEGLPLGQQLFYGIFASYGGQNFGQRDFARVVVGDATGAVTYEPMSEEFDPVLNPFDLAFSQLTFVPLIDFREVAASESPENFVNLSNYRVQFQPNVFRFPVERGPNAIPLPFRELETISGQGRNEISGPAPGANSFLMTLPNAVPLFGQFNRDLVISAQGFVTFNSPADTVGLTQGNFSPLLIPTYESFYRIPRIALLFGELSPQTGGSVWMRIMDDRVVVTFEDVPEWPTAPPRRSSAQLELFHNGQIRMTFLQVNAQELVVGLSDGKGTPIDPAQAEFVFPGRLMSKLSGFSAPLPLQLTPIPVLIVREGETVDYTPEVIVPAGSPAPVFDAVDEPFGLTVNPNTGRIQWATDFTDSGLYQFDVIASSGSLVTSQRVVVIVENVNQIPVTTEVEVSPGIPTENDVLRVNWDYSHPEDIPQGQTQTNWFRNGQMVVALANETFVPDFVTKPGERWYAEVTPRTITGLAGQRVRSNVVFIAPVGDVQPVNGDKFDADVNQDGVVNAIDVQLVINAALSGVKTNPRTDINQDGKVNAVDVQLVINGALD